MFIKELTKSRTESDYISFLNSCFGQIVEAKSKAMGCWVR